MWRRGRLRRGRRHTRRWRYSGWRWHTRRWRYTKRLERRLPLRLAGGLVVEVDVAVLILNALPAVLELTRIRHTGWRRHSGRRRHSGWRRRCNGWLRWWWRGRRRHDHLHRRAAAANSVGEHGKRRAPVGKPGRGVSGQVSQNGGRWQNGGRFPTSRTRVCIMCLGPLEVPPRARPAAAAAAAA